MYDELKNDLTEKNSDFPRRKIPAWGSAIKSLIESKQSRGENVSIPWLAKQTGINDKHLFNIVAGRIRDPSSEKLVKIADALGIPFSELASRSIQEWPGSFFISSFGQRGIIQYPQHGFSIQALTPPGTSMRDFFVGIMIIQPLRELKKWKFRDHSMICIYLESGTLEISYGGKIRKLHANESAYFDGGIPHKFRNLDTIDARLMLITRPPIH